MEFKQLPTLWNLWSLFSVHTSPVAFHCKVSQSLLLCMCSLTLSQRLKNTPMWLSGAPSLCSSFFSGILSCKLWQPQWPETLTSASSVQQDYHTLLGFHLFVPSLKSTSRQKAKAIIHGAHPVCFPFLRDHCTALPIFQCLKIVASYILLNPWFISLKVHFSCLMERLDTCINEAGDEGGLDKYGSRKGRDRTDLKHILELNWPQATR